MSRNKLPKLPEFLHQKLTKTGYTRGASPRTLFQNRVTRNNTVLIRHDQWDACKPLPTRPYENGYLVLVNPAWYYGDSNAHNVLERQGLELGLNSILVYEKREDWETHGPPKRLLDGTPQSVAKNRVSPLDGNYVARVHSTTSQDTEPVVHGFNTTKSRGVGIRVYEYASQEQIEVCKIQLEALMWLCHDSSKIAVKAGMKAADVEVRKESILERGRSKNLLDMSRLRSLRILNEDGYSCCPLCLESLNMEMFLTRQAQAMGRETYDLTVTEISLFHIQELSVGAFAHRPYNLGWGHHHCNVVVRDQGIQTTLQWMGEVLRKQAERSESQSSGNSACTTVVEA